MPTDLLPRAREARANRMKVTAEATVARMLNALASIGIPAEASEIRAEPEMPWATWTSADGLELELHGSSQHYWLEYAGHRIDSLADIAAIHDR